MPEWQLVGGLSRGGFIYEHLSGCRAYVHVNDDGDIDVATWDPADERSFPDQEALETIVAEDLRRLRESGRSEDRAILMLSGFDEFREVRTTRGRKKKRDRSTLAQFARDVEEQGLAVASEGWSISRRRGLELMRQAEAAGVARIERSDRQRSRNTYIALPVDESRLPSALERADWHRRGWLELRSLASALERNGRHRQG